MAARAHATMAVAPVSITLTGLASLPLRSHIQARRGPGRLRSNPQRCTRCVQRVTDQERLNCLRQHPARPRRGSKIIASAPLPYCAGGTGGLSDRAIFLVCCARPGTVANVDMYDLGAGGEPQKEESAYLRVDLIQPAVAPVGDPPQVSAARLAGDLALLRLFLSVCVGVCKGGGGTMHRRPCLINSCVVRRPCKPRAQAKAKKRGWAGKKKGDAFLLGSDDDGAGIGTTTI